MLVLISGLTVLVVSLWMADWPSSIRHGPRVHREDPAEASGPAAETGSTASTREALAPASPAPSLAGIVRDAGTGRCLESVELRLYGPRDTLDRGVVLDSTSSDATGRFELRAPETKFAAGLFLDARLPAYHKWFQLLEGIPQDPIDVLLHRVAFVEKVGRVVDPQGTGIPGVQVNLESDFTNLYEFNDVESAGASVAVVTGADGTFVMEAFPAKEPFSISFDAGGRWTRTRLELVHANDDLRSPPITLLPACTWTINTVDRGGRPVADLELVDRPAPGELQDILDRLSKAGRAVALYEAGERPPGWTDENGLMEFRHVPLGRHRLEARSDGKVVASMDAVLSAPLETTTFEIGAGPDLTVLLTDEDGNRLHDFATVSRGNWQNDIPNRIHSELGASCAAVALEAALHVQSATGQVQRIVLKESSVRDGKVQAKVDAFPAVVSLRLGQAEVDLETAMDRGAVITMQLDADAIHRFIRDECGIIKLRVRDRNGGVPRGAYAVLHRLARDEHGRYRSIEWALRPGHLTPHRMTLMANAGPNLLMVRAPEMGQTSKLLEVLPGQVLDAGEFLLDEGEPVRIRIQGPADWSGVAEVSMTRVSTQEPVMLFLGAFECGTHVNVAVPPGVFNHRHLARGKYRLLVAAEGCELLDEILDVGIGGPPPVHQLRLTRRRGNGK